MSCIWPQKLPRAKPLAPHRSLPSGFSIPHGAINLVHTNPSLAFSRAPGCPFPSFALCLSTFKTKPNNFSRTLLAGPAALSGCRADTCLRDGNIPRVRLQPSESTSKALAKQPLQPQKVLPGQLTRLPLKLDFGQGEDGDGDANQQKQSWQHNPEQP